MTGDRSRRRAPRLRAAEIRTLRAAAEAMAPGGHGLPAAAGPDRAGAGEVDIGPPMQRFFGYLPPARVALIRLALRVFERAPLRWRFSRGSLEARQAFLRRMDSSRSPVRQDLLLLVKVLVGSGYCSDRRVSDAVGSRATCATAASPASADTGGGVDGHPLGELAPDGDGEDCDVVIVGSGAGGASAASVLAAAGLDVVVLEAGPYMDRHSYPEEPLEALTALYRDGGLTVADGLPAIPTPVGRAVGGTTVVNSGTCFRAPREVLDQWRERAGISWACDLDEAFTEAEEILEVTPVDPELMGRNGQLLLEGAEALGLSHHPLSRNAGRCHQCSSCPFGCRLDAKRAMHVSYLPRAVAAGARVRAGVEAEQVLLEGRRAIGVRCVRGVADRAGASPRPYTVRARRAVIVAGGAFGTPELLIRSGVRSRSDQLGRNLRIHPACWVGARFDEEVRGWEGVMQSYAVDEWKDRGVLLEATFTPLAFGGHWMPGVGGEHQRNLADYSQIASTGVHLSDRSSGRVGVSRQGHLRISYRLRRSDALKLTFGIARAAELFYAAGAREVFPQIGGITGLPPSRINDLDARPPATRRLRLEAFHPLGTARMDANPTRGVTDIDGAVHGYKGLYVADASLFAGSIGVNPMMTVIVIASQVARRLAANA